MHTPPRTYLLIADAQLFLPSGVHTSLPPVREYFMSAGLEEIYVLLKGYNLQTRFICFQCFHYARLSNVYGYFSNYFLMKIRTLYDELDSKEAICWTRNPPPPPIHKLQLVQLYSMHYRKYEATNWNTKTLITKYSPHLINFRSLIF